MDRLIEKRIEPIRIHFDTLKVNLESLKIQNDNLEEKLTLTEKRLEKNQYTHEEENKVPGALDWIKDSIGSINIFKNSGR